ncbi:hypothetical protein DI43_01220 [Geobacillus sp. CAMR12739]|nr:hypothetical protein DI43_01220 [Geobacillus sp. CAMR12739]
MRFFILLLCLTELHREGRAKTTQRASLKGSEQEGAKLIIGLVYFSIFLIHWSIILNFCIR